MTIDKLKLKNGLTPTLILLTLVFVTSCAKTESKLLAIDINGTWYLNRWTTYHTLTFDDSTVYVDNSIDTVFTLNYFIDDNLLFTTTQNENKTMVDTILMLTSDSLVLSGIRDVKEKRIYFRTKKEWSK